MSSEKTETLLNTEDYGESAENAADAAEEGSGGSGEEKQTPAETIREGTAYLDVDGKTAAFIRTGDGPEEETAQVSGMTIRKEKDPASEEGGDTGEDAAEETESAESTSDEAEAGEEGEPEEDGAAEEEGEPEKDPEAEEIKKRIRERKREKKRKARRRRTVFWTVLTLIVLTIGGFIFSLSGFFTVDSIEVHGNSHFTAEEIINIAHAVPGHNLIYSPDKKTITDYLEQNPYIKSASVSRKLPSTLVITVNERAEAISFSYDDDFLIMDDEGILLKKTRTEPKITRVKGLVVTKIRLGDTVGTENQQMFSKLLRLVRAMKKADLYFVSIDMSGYADDGSVRAYIYDKLIVKSDYDSLMTNLKNGRLHKIVETLFEDDVKRGTITLGADGSASFEPGI